MRGGGAPEMVPERVLAHVGPRMPKRLLNALCDDTGVFDWQCDASKSRMRDEDLRTKRQQTQTTNEKRRQEEAASGTGKKKKKPAAVFKCTTCWREGGSSVHCRLTQRLTDRRVCGVWVCLERNIQLSGADREPRPPLRHHDRWCSGENPRWIIPCYLSFR